MILEAGAQLIYNSSFSFAFPNIDNQLGGTITLNAADVTLRILVMGAPPYCGRACPIAS